MMVVTMTVGSRGAGIRKGRSGDNREDKQDKAQHEGSSHS